MGRSFLLLSISCVSQKAQQDHQGDDVVPAVQAHVKAEDAVADDGKTQESGDGQQDDVVQSSGTGDPPAAADGGGKEDGGAEVASKMPPRGNDGCRLGQMQFEGKCMPKSYVTRVLERREAEALEKVRTADEPGQAAQAAHDLIEQQIQQMSKSEDDLDEILEQLRRENEARKGPPPDKQEDRP